MTIDWEHDELPEHMDFGFEVEWLRAVMEPILTTADASARAALMMVDHMPPQPDTIRGAALLRQMELCAQRASRHALLARVAYDALEYVDNHDASAHQVAEIHLRVLDVGLNLAEVVGMLRHPTDEPVVNPA